MHDLNGTELKVGDVVNVPCVVKGLCLSEGDGYCNVQLETIFGRRPDGKRDHLLTLNTGQMVLSRRPEVVEVPKPAPIVSEVVDVLGKKIEVV